MRGPLPLLVALLLAVSCPDDAAPVDAAGSADGAPDSAIQPDATSSSGKIGDPCAEDKDCDLDRCLLQRGSGVFPDGYCSRSCDAVTDPCPTGAYCVGTADGDCFKRCSDGSECRGGYLCQEGPGGGAPEICFPE